MLHKTKILRIGTNQKLSKAPLPSSLVATFGNLDGLHTGHSELLQRVKQNAGSLPTALITLYPHPSEVFGHVTKLERILSVRELLRVISSFGIDYLIYIHFNKDLASLDYQDFVKTYFISRLKIKSLVIGEDARVGKNALGTADKIKEVLAAADSTVDILPFVKDSATGDKISSRKIREMIKSGDCQGARRVLGRPFFIEGKVVHGSGRGKPIGFPTLNIHYPPNHILPPLGVYVVTAEIDGRRYDSVCNIGVRPTFGEQKVKIEVHIPDQKLDSQYGKYISVAFHDRIREERKFNSVDDLKTQIGQDIESMKSYYKATRS